MSLQKIIEPGMEQGTRREGNGWFLKCSPPGVGLSYFILDATPSKIREVFKELEHNALITNAYLQKIERERGRLERELEAEDIRNVNASVVIIGKNRSSLFPLRNKSDCYKLYLHLWSEIYGVIQSTNQATITSLEIYNKLMKDVEKSAKTNNVLIL